MTLGDKRALICPHCDRPTAAEICGEAVWGGHDATGEQINPPVEYTLVQCDVCGDASLQIREDYGGGFHHDEPALVYPASRRLSWEVPDTLRTEYTEAQTCFKSKAYTATVVMVRRTLEGTCAENGVRERNLQRALKKLEEQGSIDRTLSEWADALRVLGNEGAHFTGERVSREDAEDALNFAEALLDHLYVLKRRFQTFKERRQSLRSDAGADAST